MLSPPHATYFEASHWPTSVTWSLSRPLIGQSNKVQTWWHPHDSLCVDELHYDPWPTPVTWLLLRPPIAQSTWGQNWVHSNNSLCVDAIDVEPWITINWLPPPPFLLIYIVWQFHEFANRYLWRDQLNNIAYSITNALLEWIWNFHMVTGFSYHKY